MTYIYTPLTQTLRRDNELIAQRREPYAFGKSDEAWEEVLAYKPAYSEQDYQEVRQALIHKQITQ